MAAGTYGSVRPETEAAARPASGCVCRLLAPPCARRLAAGALTCCWLRRFSRRWSVAMALMVASGLFVVVTFDPSGSSVHRFSCLCIRLAGRGATAARRGPAARDRGPRARARSQRGCMKSRWKSRPQEFGGSLQLTHPHPYPRTHAQVELAATSAPRMAKPISSEPHMVHAAESATARCTHANCKEGLRWLWGAPVHI
jgi:hypothetical protein